MNFIKNKDMYTELNKDNLEEEILNNETVIVQYSAGWCGNCRVMKPKFKRYGQESSDE